MQEGKKPKVLFLIPYSLGIAPGQRFRFEQYVDFLSSHYDISYSCFINQNTYSILYSKNTIKNLSLKIVGLTISSIRLLLRIPTFKKFDVIFIYREVSLIGPPFVEWILFKLFKKKIIYDFDDAIWLPNVSNANKYFGWLKFPNKTSKIISYSKLVTVGNNYLAEYAKKFNPNVVIIPTTIDVNYHCRKERKINSNKIIIGWTGSVTTNKHLATLLSVIKKIKFKYKDYVDFIMISNLPIENTESLIRFIPWNKNTEIEDLEQFDIGIMPLTDDEWSKGKCGFKGLQYMALEIPTIMSPVGVNTEIIQDGVNGFLASTEDEWFEKISLLIDNEDLRMQIGKNGRKTIEQKYSKQVWQDKYLEYFEQVLNSIL